MRWASSSAQRATLPYDHYCSFRLLHFQIDGSYNLKYFLNMAGPDVLCVGSSSAAQIVLKRIEREASHRYQTLTLPEEGPSGCLFINGTLLHRTKEETPKCEAVSFVRFLIGQIKSRVYISTKSYLSTQIEMPNGPFKEMLMLHAHLRTIVRFY